jgi:hypothetical protein
MNLGIEIVVLWAWTVLIVLVAIACVLAIFGINVWQRWRDSRPTKPFGVQ